MSRRTILLVEDIPDDADLALRAAARQLRLDRLVLDEVPRNL